MERTNQLYIKGMVCKRCVSVIRDGIQALGLQVEEISLGKIRIHKKIDSDEFRQIQSFLNQNGFDLINDRHFRMITHIKEIVNRIFSQSDKSNIKSKFSTLLADSLHLNYSTISEIFSKSEGITLEQYIINTRLEKVKELLVYSEYTLTEIAHVTGFSSINHMSGQFKELTGLPPSHFKALRKRSIKV